jgi:hypothetical protein
VADGTPDESLCFRVGLENGGRIHGNATFGNFFNDQKVYTRWLFLQSEKYNTRPSQVVENQWSGIDSREHPVLLERRFVGTLYTLAQVHFVGLMMVTLDIVADVTFRPGVAQCH